MTGVTSGTGTANLFGIFKPFLAKKALLEVGCFHTIIYAKFLWGQFSNFISLRVSLFNETDDFDLYGLGSKIKCLTPLSTIFQLYHNVCFIGG